MRVARDSLIGWEQPPGTLATLPSYSLKSDANASQAEMCCFSSFRYAREAEKRRALRTRTTQGRERRIPVSECSPRRRKQSKKLLGVPSTGGVPILYEKPRGLAREMFHNYRANVRKPPKCDKNLYTVRSTFFLSGISLQSLSPTGGLKKTTNTALLLPRTVLYCIDGIFVLQTEGGFPFLL